MLEPSFAISVFIAGIVTFLAPCTFPLVPGYLGFLSGATHHHLFTDDWEMKKCRWRMVTLGLFYVLGFSLVFILIGTGVGFLGSFLRINRWVLFRFGGILIMFFGLMVMGVLKLPSWLNVEKHVRLPKQFRRPGRLSAFLFGAAFSLGWSPCIGPILGSVLTMSAVSASAWSGAVLLAVFSAGLAVPFLLVAYFAGFFFSRIPQIEKWLKYVSFVGGAFLVVFGALCILNQQSVALDAMTGWYENLRLYEKLLPFF